MVRSAVRVWPGVLYAWKSVWSCRRATSLGSSPKLNAFIFPDKSHMNYFTTLIKQFSLSNHHHIQWFCGRKATRLKIIFSPSWERMDILSIINYSAKTINQNQYILAVSLAHSLEGSIYLCGFFNTGWIWAAFRSLSCSFCSLSAEVRACSAAGITGGTCWGLPRSTVVRQLPGLLITGVWNDRCLTGGKTGRPLFTGEGRRGRLLAEV